VSSFDLYLHESPKWSIREIETHEVYPGRETAPGFFHVGDPPPGCAPEAGISVWLLASSEAARLCCIPGRPAKRARLAAGHNRGSLFPPCIFRNTRGEVKGALADLNGRRRPLGRVVACVRPPESRAFILAERFRISRRLSVFSRRILHRRRPDAHDAREENEDLRELDDRAGTAGNELLNELKPRLLLRLNRRLP
jgi:hypothetical protein